MKIPNKCLFAFEHRVIVPFFYFCVSLNVKEIILIHRLLEKATYCRHIHIVIHMVESK